MAKGRVTKEREVCLLVDRPSARYLRLGMHMKPGRHPILGLAVTLLVPPKEKSPGGKGGGERKRTGKKQKRKEGKG